MKQELAAANPDEPLEMELAAFNSWVDRIGAVVAAATTVNISLGNPGNFDIVATPDEMEEGSITFAARNDDVAAITHEFLLIKTDTLAADLISNAPIGLSFDESGYDVRVDSGDLPEGATYQTTVSLEAGHYVAVCNEPGHAHNGMATDFTVAA